MEQSILIAVFAILGVILLAWLALRLMALRMQMHAGDCPRCHQDLVRIHRLPWQRALSVVIPGLHRYECRHCGWSGLQVHRRK